MSGQNTSKEDSFSAFRHSAFKRFFWARFLTATAIQILATAVAWQIYIETKNALLLGLIGLVQFLPALILVLVTGLAADVLGRRRVMGSAILLMMICALGILILSLTGTLQPTFVLIILTVLGIARAFHSPASSSLVVNVVPKQDFPNAVGWVTSSWQLATIVGPALGGLLIAISGPLAYSISAIILCFAALLIFSLEKPNQQKETDPTDWETIVGGFQYIWKEKIILGAMTLDLFAILLGGAVALLPIYAEDILNVGAIGNGLLRAAPGIGAIITVILLVRFPIRNHAGPILLFTVAAFGAATAVFGISKIAWVSILALALVGAFDMVSVYIREILVQFWTPDRVRGRVNAVNGIFIGASNEVGEFRAGAMAALFGAVFTVTIGGVAAIGIAASWRFLFPKMSKTGKLEAPDFDA